MVVATLLATLHACTINTGRAQSTCKLSVCNNLRHTTLLPPSLRSSASPSTKDKPGRKHLGGAGGGGGGGRGRVQGWARGEGRPEGGREVLSASACVGACYFCVSEYVCACESRYAYLCACMRACVSSALLVCMCVSSPAQPMARIAPSAHTPSSRHTSNRPQVPPPPPSSH